MIDRLERQLKVLAAILGVVIAGGTLGYMLLTGGSFLDALYMTVITITTVGYREVFPPSAGVKIFSIVLVLAGVGSIFYGVTVIMQMAVEGQLRRILGRRRMEKELKGLKQHYIIAGYGRVGRTVCDEFRKAGRPVAVIERNPETAAGLLADGIHHLQGNATEDEVLLAAGITQAQALISAIPSEAENVYLVMSARQLNPGLQIIARSDSAEAEKKLYRAGATRVICPYQLGGTRMALSILRPNVVDLMQIAMGPDTAFTIEELRVPPGSRLDGAVLRDSGLRTDLGLIVVAIKRADNTIEFNPGAESRITGGDVLVVVGRGDKWAELDRLVEKTR